MTLDTFVHCNFFLCLITCLQCDFCNSFFCCMTAVIFDFTLDAAIR